MLLSLTTYPSWWVNKNNLSSLISFLPHWLQWIISSSFSFDLSSNIHKQIPCSLTNCLLSCTVQIEVLVEVGDWFARNAQLVLITGAVAWLHEVRPYHFYRLPRYGLVMWCQLIGYSARAWPEGLCSDLFVAARAGRGLDADKAEQLPELCAFRLLLPGSQGTARTNDYISVRSFR